MLEVYTDGSCLNNGKKNSIGGVGIYCPEINLEFSKNSKDIYKEFFDKSENYIHTNQKSELLAILKAINILKVTESKSIMIKTDSMYSINCIQSWCKNWKKNNWKTKNGKDVKNKDIIMKISQDIEEIDKHIFFEHVKAHSVNLGNNKADELSRNCLF